MKEKLKKKNGGKNGIGKYNGKIDTILDWLEENFYRKKPDKILDWLEEKFYRKKHKIYKKTNVEKNAWKIEKISH